MLYLRIFHSIEEKKNKMNETKLVKHTEGKSQKFLRCRC